MSPQIKLKSLARLALAAVAALLASAPGVHAQGVPTAGRGITLSGFGAASGAWTGLSGGRNVGITAGFDVGLRSFFGFKPEAEIRATYPLHSGSIVGEKDFLGGIKVGRDLFHTHLYGDFLAGRGEMEYQRKGYPFGNLLYQSSSTPVYSFGGGAEYGITDHFALKGDYQFQRWKTPVTDSGSVHPQVLSLGIVYRINTSRYPQDRRHRRGAPPPPPPQPAPADTQPAPTPSITPPPPQ